MLLKLIHRTILHVQFCKFIVLSKSDFYYNYNKLFHHSVSCFQLLTSYIVLCITNFNTSTLFLLISYPFSAYTEKGCKSDSSFPVIANSFLRDTCISTGSNSSAMYTCNGEMCYYYPILSYSLVMFDFCATLLRFYFN